MLKPEQGPAESEPLRSFGHVIGITYTKKQQLEKTNRGTEEAAQLVEGFPKTS